jgi:hypothetical protein
LADGKEQCAFGSGMAKGILDWGERDSHLARLRRRLISDSRRSSAKFGEVAGHESAIIANQTESGETGDRKAETGEGEA